MPKTIKVVQLVIDFVNKLGVMLKRARTTMEPLSRLATREFKTES